MTVTVYIGNRAFTASTKERAVILATYYALTGKTPRNIEEAKQYLDKVSAMRRKIIVQKAKDLLSKEAKGKHRMPENAKAKLKDILSKEASEHPIVQMRLKKQAEEELKERLERGENPRKVA